MSEPLVPMDRIEKAILLIRGQKVMLDRDLAELYGVETGALNRAASRNAERFPEDFMFQLTSAEFEVLKCHFGIAKQRGGRRTPPYAFTEQGVAMLSSVEKKLLLSIDPSRAISYDHSFLTVMDKREEEH